MLTERLKTETLVQHQQLEKVLILRMKAMRSKHDYTNLLQLFYSYFGGLEELIAPYINQETLSDYSTRRKSAALADDINAMGSTPVAKAGPTNLPVIDSTLKAFAALYVIEGSTLGGKIISKMMAQQLGITDGKGLTFFTGYGEDTETRWDSFRLALNKQAQSAVDEDTIIRTSNDTFAKFKTWMEKQ